MCGWLELTSALALARSLLRVLCPFQLNRLLHPARGPCVREETGSVSNAVNFCAACSQDEHAHNPPVGLEVSQENRAVACWQERWIARQTDTRSPIRQKDLQGGNQSPPYRDGVQGGMDSRWRSSWRAAVSVIPSGRLPCATSIDDAGEQRKRSSSLLAAGTEAQAAGDDPVAQQTFGRIVGEWQAGVEQRPNDRFPIVEHLPAKLAEFDEGTVLP